MAKNKDFFGFNKAINWNKLKDPKVLKKLEKIFEEKKTNKRASERASRRDNMKPKEKRERKLKAWILKYIRNLKKLPKLPKPNKEGKIGIKWLQVEEDIYLTAKDQFYGIYGYGNDKDWNDGKMSWVFWYVCDEVENLINKLKQQASEQKG